MSTENKISKEVAEAQIESFLDYYGIDKADIELEDGVEAVQTMFNTLSRAIRRGVLEIVDDGELEITHRLVRPVTVKESVVANITYLDRVGKAKISMDTVGGKKNQSKQNQFMSVMGDIPISVLINLKGFDATVYSRLSLVFSLV